MSIVQNETWNSIPQGIWSTSMSYVQNGQVTTKVWLLIRELPEFLSDENIQTNTSFKQTNIHMFRPRGRLQN